MESRPDHKSLRPRIRCESDRARRRHAALADAPPGPHPGDVYILPPRGELDLVKLVVLRSSATDDGWWVMAADDDPLARDDEVDLVWAPEAVDAQAEPMTLRGDRVICVASQELPVERRVGRLSRADLSRALGLRGTPPPATTDVDLARTLASVDRQLRGCVQPVVTSSAVRSSSR